MHRELVIEAFRKAEDHLRADNGNAPSTRQIAIELSVYLSEDYGFPFGERRLRDYYNATKNSEEINITQKEVIRGLCKYMGFETYQAYSSAKLEAEHTVHYGKDSLTGKPEVSVKTKNKGFFAWFSNASAANRKIYKRIGIALFLGIIGTASAKLMFSDSQKWMKWNKDHYEEAEFSEDHLNNGILSIYKEDQVEKFKQIHDADCNYQFFNADGSERVWYGKNKNGELELFTDIGLHPETGKTLKPITEYMIRKYICETY